MHFTSMGIKVSVVTPQDYVSNSEIKNFNEGQSFQITTFPRHQMKFLQDVTRLMTFTSTLSAFEPQMVIASGSRSIWLSALCLPVRNIPWVIIGHGTEFGTCSGLAAKITRHTANRAHGTICVSAYTQHAMRESGVINPQSTVIHNGADDQAFYPLPISDVLEFRQKEAVADKFVLLTVGNVTQRKGQEVVIRALPEILEKHPNTIYWIAGLPTEKPYLERLAGDLCVSHAIRFWGRVDSDLLLKLYNACDFFVMTSRQLADGDFEGYGIAVLEAALCGKPALVSDNSGLVEAVQDGITGVVVPQDDSNSTASAILKLINSPTALRNLGEQAQRNANKNQTWGQVAIRYIHYLRQIYSENLR
jgi:phosphatidyl-myo-inositol dimannoside synthase